MKDRRRKASTWDCNRVKTDIFCLWYEHILVDKIPGNARHLFHVVSVLQVNKHYENRKYTERYDINCGNGFIILLVWIFFKEYDRRITAHLRYMVRKRKCRLSLHLTLRSLILFETSWWKRTSAECVILHILLKMNTRSPKTNMLHSYYLYLHVL
jgi:hypothetical protein